MHELATVKAGESAFALKIERPALKALAVYDALFWRPIGHHFFALSPSSTSRRMASERRDPLASAHASTIAINSSDARKVRAGSLPVGRRPRFLGMTFLVDADIKRSYRFMA